MSVQYLEDYEVVPINYTEQRFFEPREWYVPTEEEDPLSQLRYRELEVDETVSFFDLEAERLMIQRLPEVQLTPEGFHFPPRVPCPMHLDDCPQFVEHESLWSYLSDVSDIELRWFERRDCDPAHSSPGHYKDGSFFNYSAHIHWRKWGSALEVAVRTVKPKRRWEPELSKVRTLELQVAYITRSNLSCAYTGGNSSASRSLLFLMYVAQESFIAVPDPGMIVYTPSTTIVPRKDGTAATVKWDPSRLTRSFMRTINRSQRYPRANPFMFGTGPKGYIDDNRVYLSTPNGPLRLDVELPLQTVALNRLARVKEFSRMFSVPMINDRVVHRAFLGWLYDEPILMGVVRDNLFLSVDRVLPHVPEHQPRFKAVRRCTCMFRESGLRPQEVQCYSHGFLLFGLGLTIVVGDETSCFPKIKMDIWIHRERPRLHLMPAVSRPKDKERMLSSQFKDVWGLTYSGLVYGLPYPSPVFGHGLSFVSRFDVLPYSFRLNDRIGLIERLGFAGLMFASYDLILGALSHFYEIEIVLRILVEWYIWETFTLDKGSYFWSTPTPYLPLKERLQMLTFY